MNRIAMYMDMVIRPLGSTVQLVKNGEAPGLEEYYSAPDGRGYVVFSWRCCQHVWVSQAELDRLKAVARGRREPFVSPVATVAPVPDARRSGRSISADWARELVRAEDAEALRQAAACQ
jgi:hypothetical protein